MKYTIFCKDCRHCVRYTRGDDPDMHLAECGLTEIAHVVSGRIMRRDCFAERMYTDSKCGPEARNFAPKLEVA